MIKESFLCFVSNNTKAEHLVTKDIVSLYVTAFLLAYNEIKCGSFAQDECDPSV
jgi:hypothetical protein